MRYEIIGRDTDGRPACFEVEADSMERAIEMAAAQHVHVERVQEMSPAPAAAAPRSRASELALGPEPMSAPRIALIVAGTVALLVVAGVLAAISLGPVMARNTRQGPPPPGQAYFYDTVTRTYFTDRSTRIAPIVSPEGNVGIRAHFFTCGQCTDDEKFLGYYEKYALEIKEQIESKPESMHFYEEVFQGRFYCPPGADPTRAQSWVAAESDAGFDIAQRLQQKCPARKLRYCPPPRTLSDR